MQGARRRDDPGSARCADRFGCVRGSRSIQVVGLLGLSAVGAELLAAYGDGTGDPGAVAFALVFFGALYGAPALLSRDFVRRRGWGWPSLLLIYAALGVVQACLIDQSMLSADYGGYEGWEEIRGATLIPALGVSAYNAFNFVVGHVIFSFAAPVAVAEAWAPGRAHVPWLGRFGTVVAVLAYLGAAGLIVADPGSHSGSVPQLLVSAGLAATLIGAAVVVGRRARRASAPGTAQRPVASADQPDAAAATLPSGQAPSVRVVLAATMGGAAVASMVPETWLGVLVGVVATSAVGAGVLVASRRSGWSVRHSAAVGLGFLLVRGLWAFLYYPLLGEVEAGPKYAHNVVMLAAVLLAGRLALRPPRGS